MSAQARTPAHPSARTPAQRRPRAAALVGDSHIVLEGGGVPVRRVLPSREVPYRLVDPWLLLDDGRLESVAPGQFPSHPHRGFEIVTYVLEGAFRQEIDAGESGEVRAGGLLRTTAGRGTWHGEGGGSGLAGPLHALQLWINLPRALKQMAPGMQAVPAEEIPEQTVGDARVRVLVGEGSPTRLQTPARYLDASLPAGGTSDLPMPDGSQGFAYLLRGSGAFGATGLQARSGQVVVLGQAAQATGETAFPVRAGAGGVRFVLAAGRPIGETPRWNGPYVD